jgi:hypothetical protein
MDFSTEEINRIVAGIGRPSVSMGCGCDTVEVRSLSIGEGIYVSSSK